VGWGCLCITSGSFCEAVFTCSTLPRPACGQRVLLMGLMLIRFLPRRQYEGGEAGLVAASLFWHFVDVHLGLLFLLLLTPGCVMDH